MVQIAEERLAFYDRHFPPGLRPEGLRAQRPWLFAACGIAFGLALLAPLASLVSDGRITVMELLSDPAEVTGIPWYIGAVSDLNLLVWGAGAALFLLAALGLRRVETRLAAMLGWLGAFTVLLTLDDRFLLHEIVFPWIFGLSQAATFALYAGALMVVLICYRRVLLRQPETPILLLALLALGLSVSLDVLAWDLTARRIVEESAKLFGAVAWAAFPAAIVVRHLNKTGDDDPTR